MVAEQPFKLSIQQDIQLRFVVPGDAEEIRVLCEDWFPIEYPDTWYRDITSNPKFYALAATYRNKIMGLVVSEVKTLVRCNKEDQNILASSFPDNSHVAYILSLGVAKEFRRLGIASLLLDTLYTYVSRETNCRALFLHVLATNHVAIEFYEKRNFRRATYLPYYYSINGVAQDGFSYVLYMNGGRPPWSLRDYASFCANGLSQMCRFPLRALHATQYFFYRFCSWRKNKSSNYKKIPSGTL